MHARILERLVAQSGIALALLLLCGCNQGAMAPHAQTAEVASDAGGEEAPVTEADVPMPADYAEAIERLCGYRDAIQKAVDSGQLHDAHRPLDETNIAIERLPALARSSGVPRNDWEQVVVAGEDLAEALDEIHSQIDAGQKPDYAAHAAAIDEALARLKAAGQTNRADNSPHAKIP